MLLDPINNTLRLIIIFIIFIIIIAIAQPLYQHLPYTAALADSSPQFSQQEILDRHLDWVNMNTRNYTQDGERSTDIWAVDYFSDGKALNATLWLYYPFKIEPDPKYSQVNYGMLIDSDFDNRTGYDGIDYQLEVGWNNQSKIWDKKLTEWSPTKEERTIFTIHNYTGFFEKKPNSEDARRYVLLSLPLNSIQFPKKYKVTFYAESVRNGISITDFTRWVAIPPLQISLITSPPTLVLRPGENKTIDLEVNATAGYQPIVLLSSSSDHSSNKIESGIKFNRLQIPSYGVATTPMFIAAAGDAPVRPYNVIIEANSSFPSQEVIKVNSNGSSSSSHSLVPESEKLSRNTYTQTIMAVTVEPPPSFVDQFSDLWNKVGSPITFFYGIAAGISPLIIMKFRKRQKENSK